MTEHPPLHRFEASVESKLLYAELRKMKIGDQLTYAQLSDIAGIKIDGSSSPLITARKRMQNDHDIVIACNNGVGVVRLNDEEIIEDGRMSIAFIRRKSGRALDRMKLVNFNMLDESSKRQTTAMMGMMGTISMMTREREITRIAESMPANRTKLSVDETLNMFRSKPEAGQS